MVIQPRLMTVDEFEVVLSRPENRDRLLELVDGVVAEKMPNEEHGRIVILIGTALQLYARVSGGRVTTEARHRAPEDQYNDRLPDLAYTSPERKLPLAREGAVLQMPDLAIEIKSPSNTLTELREKAYFYLSKGARMAWVVFPDKQLVEVYTPDSDVEIFTAGDVITGGNVLPGFRMPVAEIFAD